MVKRMYRRQASGKKSVFIALSLILVLFLSAGFLGVRYFEDFYHKEKFQEATFLAYAYANSMESLIDARSLLTEQFHKTLTVAGQITAMQQQPYSNELLTDLATSLNVDVIYAYDDNLTIEYTSDSQYLGWVAPKDHPVRRFYESGVAQAVDGVRTDTESGIYFMYSYQRLDGGKFLQVGLRVEKLADLYERLNAQWLIDQIANKSPNTHIAFINKNNIIQASSDPREKGTYVDLILKPETFGQESTTQPYIEETPSKDLKLFVPIYVGGVYQGMLTIVFDQSNVNKLVIQVTVIVFISLIFLFILFSISIINIARKNKKIFSVAYYDELTSLPTVRLLKEKMKTESHDDLALFIIHAINLKVIELTYGYSVGDTIVQEIAHKLADLSHNEVKLQAFRFSDDQFILLVQNYGRQEVLVELCTLIANIRVSTERTGSVTLCMGIVEMEGKSGNFNQLIKEASIALHATTLDKRVQFYTKAMEEKLIRDEAIEQELKQVIAGKSEALSLVYQPIVTMDDEIIISLEALARMESTQLGPISPLEFIPIAEERHLIVPLGNIIFQKACMFMRTLTELGFGSCRIAVNFSAIQLMNRELITSLKEYASAAGIDIRQMEVELTESAFTENFELLAHQVQSIHSLGIGIAIDDFGTGFSSLNRLQNLDIDTLKLDKKFVDTLSAPFAQGIASDIISMAHHLKKPVTAEGVETEMQRQLLLGMGCDYMQGYLFSKPIPEGDVIALLEKQRVGN